MVAENLAAKPWHSLTVEEVLAALGSDPGACLKKKRDYVWGGMARTRLREKMATFQWVNSFNARSSTNSLFELGPFTNRWLLVAIAVTASLQLLVIYLPPLQAVFQTVPLVPTDWGAIVAVSISILVAEEIRKAVAPRLFA